VIEENLRLHAASLCNATPGYFGVPALSRRCVVGVQRSVDLE
jgi:hypothetical protein